MEETYIPRELEKEITPFLERKEILAIVGARQVGKTTLLKHLFNEIKAPDKKMEFLTFERKKDLDLFSDIEDFKNYYSGYDFLFIDEFHYAENGGKKLKYLYDTTDIKFIISGSSSLELTFQTGKYLVGRMFKFFLYPFSFREFLKIENKRLVELLEKNFSDIFSKFNQKDFFGEEINSRLQEALEEYLVFGGYPAVALAKSEKEKKKILESILENYLLRDVEALLNLETQSELLKLAEFLSTQIGNLVKYKELSSASGLTHNQVLKHLDILESTFIANLIKPFYRNPRTEITKNPKVYFTDLGFRNYLLSNFKEIDKRNDKGHLVENFVFSQLKRYEFNKINFWRTKSKAEVDFILSKEEEIIPLEVKYSASPSPGKSFHSFLKKFSPSKGFVLTKDLSKIEKIKGATVYFIPVYYL